MTTVSTHNQPRSIGANLKESTMNAISKAFEALAARQAEHRKTRADLAETREAHAAAGGKLKRLRAGFAKVAGDAVEAESAAAEISTVEHLEAEQARLIAWHVEREREVPGAVHATERSIAGLRHRRAELEQTLARSAGDRAHLVHRVEQAEQAVEARRDLLRQHDATVQSMKAQLADISEPEAA